MEIEDEIIESLPTTDDDDDDDMVEVLEMGRRRMREFYHLIHLLLTRPERLILYKILKDYRRRRDLIRLVIGLNLVLRTNNKLELLKYVRYFLQERDIKQFDKLTKFHMKFRRRRPRTLTRNSNGISRLLQVPLPSDRTSHRSVESTNTTASTSRQLRDVRVFTLHRDPDETNLGFSVRGGSEHGLSIYVSEIDSDSAAEKCGLEVGDKILEVNNISLRGVASSSAVKLLIGSNRLKLVVQRTRKVPEWRLSREKTSWYDVEDRKLISGEFEECGISHHIRGLDVEVPERRINLKFGRSDKTLGFNIRGGREYGLGVYVSKIDRGGLADANGVRVGDQVIDVNGIPFDNITHAHAVEVLKGKRHLILTLRDVGRFPVFKELYAEYTWSNGQLKAAASATNLRDIQVVHDDEMKAQSLRSPSVADLFSSTKFPSALQTEIFLPNRRSPAKPPRNMNIIIPDRRGDAHEDDDSESLIDLDQWAQDIRDNTGQENPGYTPDDEDGEDGHDIIVHAYHLNQSVETLPIDERMSLTGSLMSKQKRLSTDSRTRTDTIESEYDTPDMIYAKINKQSNRYASTSDLSIRHSDDDVVPSTSHYRTASSNASRASSNDALHAPGSRMSENRLSVDGSVSTIDGALYSQVRRRSLNGGSPFGSNLNIAESHQTDSHSGASSPEIFALPRDNVSYSDKDENDIEHRHPYGDTEINDYNTAGSAEYANTDNIEFKDSDSESEQGNETDNVTYNTTYTADDSTDFTTNDNVSGNNELSEDYYTADGIRRPVLEDTSSHSTSTPSNPPGKLDIGSLEEKLHQLQLRQTAIGLHELNTLASADKNEPESLSGAINKKKGKWKSLKNKIKGSLRLKSPKRLTISQKDFSDSTATPSVSKKHLIKNKIDPINMATLEEEAKNLLDEDEFNAVFRHIKLYHENGDLGRLVEVLVTILDKPKKLQLLKDVRGVIYQHDIVQYDNLVNVYEIESYQKLSMKLHLPLNHRPNKSPRKTLIKTEIENTVETSDGDTTPANGEAEDGHFHIKPMGQAGDQEDAEDHTRETTLLPPTVATNATGGKGKTPITAQRKTAEEKSALDHFEYLEFEQSEEWSSIAAFSDYSHGSSEIEKIPGSIVVHLSKSKPSIGIEFVEKDVNGVKEVTIASIDPKGAANDDSTIEVGMTLLGVDRQKVEGFSKNDVLAVIEKSYRDKHFVSMKLILHKPQSTHF